MEDTHRAMTEDESRVWERLSGRMGRAHAMQRQELVALTGLGDRVVRACIESLRKDHGKLVCYATGHPGGYFLAESLEDLRACRNLEASREAHVRENRQFYDHALVAAGDTQMSMQL